MNISNIRPVVEAITVFNECVTFFQWLRSLGSRSNGADNQEHKEDDVLKLQSSLQCLRDTIPVMYNFIDRAEWRSHDQCVTRILPELKAAIYDAEDLLEDFRCYEQKVRIEGSRATSAVTEFFRGFIQGNPNKLDHIKERIDNQFKLLKAMGLHQATQCFDRLVRPETTSFSTEAKIFGRDKEIKELIRLLGVPANNRSDTSKPKRKRSAICSSASNQVSVTLDNNKATIIASVPVLPIVGIGGVGKTTLAQNICNNPKVKKHFDDIVWICVSDDFDIKRLTKEAIEQFSNEALTLGNLNSLQTNLADILNKKRFLIVLDDMWAENGELWKMFYAPFKHALHGSMMLVTTRSQKVADIVRTKDPFLLEGLKDDVFQNFFKICVFGSNSSNNDPELEHIGEQILPKLKGSPLAAKTLGRLLGRSLDPMHWNMILYSQLWELRQEETDILPALRLSYMYLPFHLKRCFSFCAVYPKDYNFVKEDLAEMWVAEGFVEPQCNISLQQTSCEYFEELAHMSFFQKLRGKYVMHDLIHDMAQLVSKDECFIINEKNDLKRIPPNVRHLSVLKSRDFKFSELGNLCKHTKLRTLFCYTSLKDRAGNTVMEKWCTELVCMRVMVCASISKLGLPDSISNMNLRYLKISDACILYSLPTTFCHLYNLQLLCARKCRFELAIPRDFSNLINLQKFESQVLKIDVGLLNKFKLVTRDLSILNVCGISKDQAAEFELIKKADIFGLTLKWYTEPFFLVSGPLEHNEVEVFEALHPPTSIKSVGLECYPGEDLPSWFHGSDEPTIFSSLTEIRITYCPRLSSLEKFLQPAYMPAIKKILITDCPSLVSVPVERFGGFPYLEELEVRDCPKINSRRLQAPSLKKLFLEYSGNLGDDIGCRSLVTFRLTGFDLEQESLTFNRENFSLLTELIIQDCRQLETLNGDWPILKTLYISSCPYLKWGNRIVLPSSLQKLKVQYCHYFSVSCLENLTSLESLDIQACKHLECIPCDLSSSNLRSLQELKIRHCDDLVSIGGPEAIAHLPRVHIQNCPKLMEVRQPLERGRPWY